MQLRKTALAHAALQTHRTALDLRQRRALILADGQRGQAELALLLGGDGAQLLDHLRQQGYLEDARAQPTPLPAAAPGPVARRSLAAARLYLLGMLELQRTAVAATLRRHLQQAQDEESIATALHEALQLLPAMTSPGYAARVRERTLEVLPEAWLPRFQQHALA